MTRYYIPDPLGYENFNSHAHVERDQNGYIMIMYSKHFNSHAHVERDQRAPKGYHSNKNFNSHAHVERDEHKEANPNNEKISTHTLTWSVTLSIHCALSV